MIYFIIGLTLIWVMFIVWFTLRVDKLSKEIVARGEPTVKCNHETKECNFKSSEPCRYAHMQVEAKQITISFEPTSTRRDYVHIYDKVTGVYIGVRAIGHPDLNDSRHKIVWPNGQEVSHGCIGVT